MVGGSLGTTVAATLVLTVPLAQIVAARVSSPSPAAQAQQMQAMCGLGGSMIMHAPRGGMASGTQGMRAAAGNAGARAVSPASNRV